MAAHRVRVDDVEVDAGARHIARCGHAVAGDEPAQLHGLACAAGGVQLPDAALAGQEPFGFVDESGGLEELCGAGVIGGPVVAGPYVSGAFQAEFEISGPR